MKQYKNYKNIPGPNIVAVYSAPAGASIPPSPLSLTPTSGACTSPPPAIPSYHHETDEIWFHHSLKINFNECDHIGHSNNNNNNSGLWCPSQWPFPGPYIVAVDAAPAGASISSSLVALTPIAGACRPPPPPITSYHHKLDDIDCHLSL